MSSSELIDNKEHFNCVPLISVIIPVYNVELFLDRCIESVINQTYTNIEIILVDDGSLDSSGSICDEYSQKDNRIKVIHKENGGLSSARNAGINVANGEYIVFIDSDDYVSHEMVEVLYKSMVHNNSDISLCNFISVDENGNEWEEKNIGSPIKDEVITSYNALRLLTVVSNNWYYVVAWNKLYKKDLFEDMEFPDGKCHEDEFIVHKIFDKCKTISCVKKPLYYYVQRSDSIMGQKYSIKRLDAVEAFANRTWYFLDKKFFDLALKTFSLSLTTISTGYKNLDLKVKENRIRFIELRKKLIDIYLKNSIIFLKNADLPTKIKILSFLLNMKLYVILESIYSIR